MDLCQNLSARKPGHMLSGYMWYWMPTCQSFPADNIPAVKHVVGFFLSTFYEVISRCFFSWTDFWSMRRGFFPVILQKGKDNFTKKSITFCCKLSSHLDLFWTLLLDKDCTASNQHQENIFFPAYMPLPKMVMFPVALACIKTHITKKQLLALTTTPADITAARASFRILSRPYEFCNTDHIYCQDIQGTCFVTLQLRLLAILCNCCW